MLMKDSPNFFDQRGIAHHRARIADLLAEGQSSDSPEVVELQRQIDTWEAVWADEPNDVTLAKATTTAIGNYQRDLENAKRYLSYLESDDPKREYWRGYINALTSHSEWIDYSKAAALIGKKGGASKSIAKRKASAENGKKGGAPAKAYQIEYSTDDGATWLRAHHDFPEIEPEYKGKTYAETITKQARMDHPEYRFCVRKR